MADEPVGQEPISDDQELAKVLAGVSQQADNAAAPQQDTAPMMPAPVMNDYVQPTVPQMVIPPVSAADPGLDGIKLEALQELRPLVDKLNVSPEEKYDTYLLLLRSTDDKALIAPAHEAAKQIADEARRAQALLDIIKEIDFLSQSQ